MTDSARPSRPLSNAALACLLAGAAGGVAALGGALPWAHLPGLLGGAVALLLVGFDHARRTPRMPWFAVLFAASTGFALLQLLPLPPAILAWASPEKAALVRFTLEPLGLGGSNPVTLDAAATWREVARGCALVCAAWAAAVLCRSRTSRQRLLGGLAALAVLVALGGLAHAALGLTRLFGMYAFSQALPVVTPFGNPNHLCGFLSLGGALLVGLLLEAKGRPRQALVLSGWAVVAWAAWASQSRAGLAAFAVGQVGAALWTLRRRGVQVWLVALGVVAAVVTAVAAEALTSSAATKFALWPDFLEGAWAHARTGMGRGTFELGYLRFQPRPFFTTWTHPENQLLQWLAEVGLVPTLMLLAGTSWAAWQLARRELTSLEGAGLAGVAAVALHNLADFSMELPAVSFAAALVVGALSRPDDEGHAPGLDVGRPAAAALGLLLLGGFASHQARGDFASAERAVAELLSARTGPAVLEAAVLPLVRAHPADGLLPAAVAWAHVEAAGGDARQALAWVNRALYVDPWNVTAHRAAARALLRLGQRGQAFLEYRLALEGARGRDQEGLPVELLARARSVEDWAVACPRDTAGVAMLVDRLWKANRMAEAEGLLARMLPELPKEVETAPLYGQLAALQAARGDAPGATSTLEAAELFAPGDVALVLQRARILAGSGEVTEAARILEEKVRELPGEGELHLVLAETLLSTEPRRAQEAAQRAQPFAAEPAQRARLLRVKATAGRKLGSPARAIEALKSLAQLQPEQPAPRYELADLLWEAGRRTEAKTWLEEGAGLDSLEGAAAARTARASWTQPAAGDTAAPTP
jgi:tetratricopeptide (TPR) repeat protein